MLPRISALALLSLLGTNEVAVAEQFPPVFAGLQSRAGEPKPRQGIPEEVSGTELGNGKEFATGQLEAAEKEKWRPICRATIVSPEGHVLTAGHCVASKSDLNSPYHSLRLNFNAAGARPPREENIVAVKVVTVNAATDSAILMIVEEKNAVATFGWRVIDSRRVMPGERLIVESRPRKECITSKHTNQFRLIFEGCTVIQRGFGTTSLLSKADSGAPVLSQGRIVGHISRETEAVSGFIARTLLASDAKPAEPGLDSRIILSADPVLVGSLLDITVLATNNSMTKMPLRGKIFITVVYEDPPFPPMETEAIVCTFNVWRPQERHSCSLRFKPNKLGELKIRYRAAFAWEDDQHWINDPWLSDTLHQGWPALVSTVGVVASSDNVVTSGVHGEGYVVSEQYEACVPAYVDAIVRGQIKPQVPYGVPAFVEYGMGDRYDHKVPASAIDGRVIGTFYAPLENLKCGEEYRYRAVALLPTTWPLLGPFVREVRGAARSLRTMPCIYPQQLPAELELVKACPAFAEIKYAANICSDNFATAVLEYGPRDGSSAYRSTLAGWNVSGFEERCVGTLEDLTCGTQYHARLNLLTLTGFIRGKELLFATPPCGHPLPPECKRRGCS